MPFNKTDYQREYMRKRREKARTYHTMKIQKVVLTQPLAEIIANAEKYQLLFGDE